MSYFQVESYIIKTGRGERSIALQGIKLTHGISNTVNLHFKEGSSLPASLGDVSNVGGLNYDGLTFTAYFHTSDFADTYKVLQTEKPIYVFFYYPSSGGETRPLSMLEIGTRAESVGEEGT